MRKLRKYGCIVGIAVLLITKAAFCFSQSSIAVRPSQAERVPRWGELRKVVDKYFTELRGRQPNDILISSEAKGSLEVLAKAGWKPKEGAKLLARVSADSDFLVRELRGNEGRKFLAATTSEALVYDRLDRLVQYPGGDRLVHSVIRLPNGPTFMRPKPTPGFGTLMDLLPKNASGKTPVDPQFNKPTGKIYTSAAWIKELEAAHLAESKPTAASKSASSPSPTIKQIGK